MKKIYLPEKNIRRLEYLVIIGLAIIPLFISLPYRVNIYLSWEGAYRLYLGEIPYKDFGLPMGIGFWVIPAIFFKIFGPYLITLVKAQVLINILSGFAFRSILKTLSVNPAVRLLAVLVYCISYSFFNFWPWYDQSVIVFEIIGLSFLIKYIFAVQRRKLVYLILGCFFLFFSFFTKQDGGGLALLIAGALMLYYSIYEKKVWPLVYFILVYLLIAAAVILPFLHYNFGYWFNYGQPPHNARLSVYDIVDAFMNESAWLKFYFMATVMIILFRLKDPKAFFRDKQQVVFSLLTLGILAEAAIFQITSYTPPDNNIFFHGFAIAFIGSQINAVRLAELSRLRILLAAAALIMLWWSGTYWKYIERYAQKVLPAEKIDYNQVSMHTYMLPEKTDTVDTNNDMGNWVFSRAKAFKKIYMPQSTAEGIDRLLNNPVMKNDPQHLKVLNMTELTPLAYETGYPMETGENIPLWYHKGVAMFEQQINTYEQKIKDHYYDVVLFEYIPRLNNFYPFEIRDHLKQDYRQIDSFSGPRRAMYSVIEVYVRPDSSGTANP